MFVIFIVATAVVDLIPYDQSLTVVYQTVFVGIGTRMCGELKNHLYRLPPRPYPRRSFGLFSSICRVDECMISFDFKLGQKCARSQYGYLYYYVGVARPSLSGQSIKKLDDNHFVNLIVFSNETSI